ncbi:MAG: Hsp20/alpha crystallin family protein [Chitinivibrionales bacterium]|nr:Hsp20/alpha crystallin family protein [Chitinivibrionales bacterium]
MNSMILYEKPLSTLSNLFNEFFNDGFYFNGSREIEKGSWPRVDITEENDAYLIKADLPGVEKKDIKITIDDGVLTISGERKNEKKEFKKGTYNYYERSFGSFIRSFALPENIDQTKVDAHYTNGTLELTLKKSEVSKPKAIEVKVD